MLWGVARSHSSESEESKEESGGVQTVKLYKSDVSAKLGLTLFSQGVGSADGCKQYETKFAGPICQCTRKSL